MVSGNGFILVDGVYKDLTGLDEFAVSTLDHSTYGRIKYIVYDGVKHCVWYSLADGYRDRPPSDWEDEL